MVNTIIFQVGLGIVFLLCCLLSLTLPGFALLRFLKIKLTNLLEVFVGSTVLGLVLFTLLAYLLAALNLRFLMWFFPVFGVFIIWRWGLEILKFKIDLKRRDFIFLITLLCIGVVLQMAVIAPSGLSYQNGLYFWSAHGRDGMWHLALMEEMQKNVFPFNNPILYGAKLQNYHFFVDLFMSEFARLFKFSNLDIYFRFTPFLYSVLIGLGSFVFLRAWSGSVIAGFWALFFSMLGGSFGYIVSFIKDGQILGGETIFWSSQTASVLGNPPQASAFVVLISILFFLLLYLRKPQNGLLVVLILLCGAIIEFKVYAGILVLGGLILISLYELIIIRKFSLIKVFIPSFLVALGLYLPNTVSSQNFLVFEPWWYIRTMIIAPERLDLLDWENKRQHYLSKGTWTAWIRIMQLELTGLLIFIVGNLGTKLIGFWELARFKGLKKDFLKIYLYFLIIISFAFPMIFLQRGVAYNTIQFLQYFLLIFGFLTALTLSNILGKLRSRILQFLLVVLVVLLTLPTHIGLISQFYKSAPPSRIDFEELKALEELKKLTTTDSVILTGPFFQYVGLRYKQPVPIHAWSETSYISAFTGRRTLIADVEQLNIMGYDVKELSDERTRVFGYPDPTVKREPDPEIGNAFFKEKRVDFVYLAWEQEFAAPIEDLNLELVFKNGAARIYKVIK